MEKFNLLDNKIKILGALCVLGLLILFFVSIVPSFLFSGSPKKVSENYKKIVLRNNLAKDTNFKEEVYDKDADSNIKMSIFLIKDSLLEKEKVLNNEAWADNKFKEISTLASNKNYKESLQKTKDVIADINDDIEKYKKEHKDDFAGINKAANKYLQNKKAVLVNHRFDGAWAVATIVPAIDSTNSANIIFKKDGSEWRKVYGPGTYFSEASVKKVLEGVPENIIKNLRFILSINLMTTMIY